MDKPATKLPVVGGYVINISTIQDANRVRHVTMQMETATNDMAASFVMTPVSARLVAEHLVKAAEAAERVIELPGAPQHFTVNKQREGS
jgi:hypothetical protein